MSNATTERWEVYRRTSPRTLDRVAFVRVYAFQLAVDKAAETFKGASGRAHEGRYVCQPGDVAVSPEGEVFAFEQDGPPSEVGHLIARATEQRAHEEELRADP